MGQCEDKGGMKIKFISNYFNPKELRIRVEKNYIDKYNYDRCLEFTDGQNYDYLIISNGSPELYKSPREKNIAFIEEPSWSPNYYRDLPRYCFKVFCHFPEIFGSPQNVIYHQSFHFMHDSHPKKGNLSIKIFKEDNNFDKKKKLSMIVSPLHDRDKSRNYYKRHALIRKVIDSDLNIDIYGATQDGKEFDISDSRYKGGVATKRQALKDYKYSIAIENCNEKGYATEKISDCFLNNTVPIYHGCPNIDEIYHPRSLIKFDPLSDTIIDELKNMMSRPNELFKEYVMESKRRYLEDYNIYNFLKKLLL
jgi:hypothetical protein